MRPGTAATDRVRDVDVLALPVGEYAFPGPARDRLVTAILDGRKTATSSLLRQYGRDGEPLPVVGDREAVVDSNGRRVCVTENVEVTVCALADVGHAHALAEGEGFESAEEWRSAHGRFWHSPQFRAEMRDDEFLVGDDARVVCVRFKVVRFLNDHIS